MAYPLHMNEKMHDAVLRHLDKAKGKHREIAACSGVPYSTVRKIAQRVTSNPGIQPVQALFDYFTRGCK
jgi:hypothetical protein